MSFPKTLDEMTAAGYVFEGGDDGKVGKVHICGWKTRKERKNAQDRGN